MRLLIILLLFASANAQELHQLAAQGLAEEIRVAVREGADTDTRDAYGQTPLMYAIDHDQLEAAEALVQAGANVNARTEAGWTPLMYASRVDWLGWAYAELLLTHGADPRIRNDAGQTARDIAKDAGGQMVALLEAAELVHDAVELRMLGEVSSVSTDEGYFVAAVFDFRDVVLLRRTATGPEVLLRLSEHSGVVGFLEELEIEWRYGVIELALADPNQDGVPDVLIRGGCECGAGPGFHILFDGATGAALSIAQASLWSYAPSRQPTHSYRFDDAAPDWMRLFLTGALTTHGFATTSAPATIFDHEARYSLP